MPSVPSAIAIGKIDFTLVERRLAVTPALVLERIAGGGGATEWYYCKDATQLETIKAHLSPGSLVSFYFDHRFCIAQSLAAARTEILDIIGRDGDCVVATIKVEPLLAATILTGPNELNEFAATLSVLDTIIYCAFPAADNDGVHAVTVTVPDEDGVVRSHPH